MQGSHPPVPEQEIQAEVVPAVRRGCVDPGDQPVVLPAVRNPVATGMSVGVKQAGNRLKDHESHRMDRHDENDADADQHLQHGLPWMKAVGRPGGGMHRPVMQAVHPAEQGAAVQQAMQPVELGIVHDQHEHDAQEKPGPAVFSDTHVEPAVCNEIETDQQAAVDDGDDQHGQQGKPDLAQDLRPFADAARACTSWPTPAVASVSNRPETSR